MGFGSLGGVGGSGVLQSAKILERCLLPKLSARYHVFGDKVKRLTVTSIIFLLFLWYLDAHLIFYKAPWYVHMILVLRYTY